MRKYYMQIIAGNIVIVTNRNNTELKESGLHGWNE
jgi:hypothetical protein